jgi:hypothetical protein
MGQSLREEKYGIHARNVKERPLAMRSSEKGVITLR